MRKVCFFILLLIFLLSRKENIRAEMFEFGDAQNVMDKYSDAGFDISETFENAKSGDSYEGIEKILYGLKGYLTDEISSNKKAIIVIILIAVGSAVLTNFAVAFGNESVSETGNMMSYMIMTGYMLAGFSLILTVARDAVMGICDFFRALIPSYFLSVGLTGAGTSAVGFYEVALIMLYVVNKILLNVMIPAVLIYVVVMIVNSINSRDYLSKFAELVQLAIVWGLKGITGVVIGINVIQSMILPSVDAVEGKTITKVIRMIPGIGGGAESIADLIIGSGALIKNAIGTTVIIGMIIIFAVPAVKLIIYIFMYKITGAILQPISEKNTIGCIDAVIDGAKLLFRILLYSVALFAVSIAVICMATNIKY